MAVGDHVEDLLAVDGIADGLTHLLVIEGCGIVVEVDRLHKVHGALEDGVAVGQLRRLGGGQLRAQIHRAGLQGVDEGGGIVIDLEGDLAERGLGAPVLVELLDDEVLLDGAGAELERAGAAGLGVELVIVRRHDGSRQEVQQLEIRLLEREDDGLVVRGLHVADDGKSRHERRVNGTPLIVGAALDGIDHILRRHRVSVVEPDAVTQGEGISQAVSGGGVLLGNSGDQFTIGAGFEQALVDVE